MQTIKVKLKYEVVKRLDKEEAIELYFCADEENTDYHYIRIKFVDKENLGKGKLIKLVKILEKKENDKFFNLSMNKLTEEQLIKRLQGKIHDK